MRMLRKEITASLMGLDEAPEQARMLLRLACEARDRAQAPYSGYHVGAALLSASGATHIGCNVERVSYTQTTHAEQNAIDCMVAKEGPTKIEMIAIVAAPGTIVLPADLRSVDIATLDLPAGIDQVITPCGHCLQCIWENCCGDRSVPLVSLTPSRLVMMTTIGDALPMAFGPDALGITIGGEPAL